MTPAERATLNQGNRDFYQQPIRTPKRTRSTTGRDLRARGFDLTTYRRPYYRPRCSQCEAQVINGIACHETGCPHSRRPNHDDD